MEKAISIYIVEDYKLTRTTYKHYFAKIENEVAVLGDFETAEECLDRLKIQPADVVLMDIGLPYMNGIEATKIITKKFPETKVIMLTSHEREDEIFAALASGAHAYTLKDIEFPALTNAIREVDKGAVWIDPRIAAIALNFFPKPQSTTDLDNLYTKNKPKKRLNVRFTDREIEILKLIKDGKTNKEIGDIIHISEHTAKSHISKILKKLSVTDRVQAAVKAMEYNLF